MKVIVLPKTATTEAVVILTPDVIDPAKTYKGIMFAHGIGQRGVGTGANVEAFLKTEVPNLLAIINGGSHIVIAPELLASDVNWTNKYFDQAYNYLTTNYKVDPKIFPTGHSWGGQEVWKWSGDNPTKIAGIVACACVYVQANFAAIKCPVLGYHSKDDGSVPFAEGSIAINQLRAAGNTQADLIPYDYAGHSICNTVYGEAKVKSLFGVTSVVPVPAPTPIPTAPLKADASATVTQISGSAGLLDGSRSTGYSTLGYKRLSWNMLQQPPKSTWDVYDMPNFSKIGEQVKLKNLIAGTYVFELTAEDGKGGVSKDPVTITVGAIAPAPTAPIVATDATGKKYNLFPDKTWTAQ